MAADHTIDPKGMICIIGAALVALFMGAMDALIMSASMPTIVADLGGMHLYSWVYSAYFLARAVSLPIFGKMADLFKTKTLFLFSIGLFLASSIAAGVAPTMGFLVAARVFQGIGAGGNFALVYIVLSDVAPPGKRAKTLSLASFIWGIASILGPTLGGVIVSYFSWRWIFFINVPLGILSLSGIGFFLKEIRARKKTVHLDIAGVTALTGFILCLLTIFIAGGRAYGWGSTEIMMLTAATMVFGFGFFVAEKRAKDPILDLEFFKIRGFAFGNGAVFFSSFAIFPLFAYAPLFIQGALGKRPMQVGLAMLSLSLGWSVGSLALGQMLRRSGKKTAAVAGALFMAAAGAATLTFHRETSMSTCFFVFLIMGLGMGFVTLATLLVVQGSLLIEDLGVATTSHQFARTLGGTVGIGICGGVVTSRLEAVTGGLPPGLLSKLGQGTENLFRPEFLALVGGDVKVILQNAVVDGMSVVFWIVLAASFLCLFSGLFLPNRLDTGGS